MRVAGLAVRGPHAHTFAHGRFVRDHSPTLIVVVGVYTSMKENRRQAGSPQAMLAPLVSVSYAVMNILMLTSVTNGLARACARA